MKTPRGIYLPDGTIHSFADRKTTKGLSDHIATRDRSPDFTALGLYLPNPDPILKRLGKDAQVYRDLRSDAPVGGAIRRRKSAVRAMEWRVVDKPTASQNTASAKASARAMLLAQDTLDRLDVYALIGEVLDAPLFGWVPIELMWQSVGGALLPMQALAKPHEWFHFDSDGLLRFRSRSNPMYGEELAPRKFLVPRQDASYANPWGFADLSMCFWPTTFRRGGLKFWVTFSEKYGTPMMVGKLPRSAGTKETDDLLDQLEAMVQDAVAVVPDDASVDIKESSGKSDAAGAYEALLMYCRSEINIALLGQNQSTEASSTHASATAGLQVSQDLRDADARIVESAINQMLRWITDLNDGEQAPAPRFELFEQAEVSDVQAKRDDLLHKAGLTFTPAYWQRAYNLKSGDIAAFADSKTQQTPSFSEGQPAPKDQIDALVDAEMDDWQRLMEPVVDPIQALFDQAKTEGWTAQRLIDALPDLLQRMDTQPLANGLTRAALIARLAGAAGIPPTDEPA